MTIIDYRVEDGCAILTWDQRDRSMNVVNGAALGELDAAIKRAVADATQKAKTLSEAAGVQLGRVLDISDQTYNAAPMPISAKAFDRAEAAAVPIEAGENAYRVQVTMSFELR